MKIVEITDVKSSSNPHGVDARKIYDTKTRRSLKKHITPVDVFFYVLEGIVEIGDEKKDVLKDTLIESPAKIPHCWYNESKKDLRILIVKVPRPEKSTKVI